jgi:hypothetical protein
VIYVDRSEQTGGFRAALFVCDVTAVTAPTRPVVLEILAEPRVATLA